MKFPLLLAALCLSTSIFAQTDDSKVKNYTRRDTTRVELLIDYCVANTFSVSDKMLKYAKEANDIAVKLNYVKGEIRALNCIGNYYYQQGINDKAIAFYSKAIRISEKANDTENIIICKSNLASIYIQIGKEKQGLNLFLESDALLVKSGKGESEHRAALLTNIGAAYSAMGLHRESLKYHTKTLSLCKAKNILFGIAIAQSNIGDELVALKEYDKAFRVLVAALIICEKNNFNSFLGQIYKDIAKVYSVRKQYNAAIESLKKGIVLCTKINDQNNLLELRKALHVAYAKTGNYETAYATSLDFIALNDSVNTTEKQRILTEATTKYETEKKEATISDLNKKKRISELQSTRKTILIYGISIAFITLAVLAYFLFSRFKIKKENELLQSKLMEAEKSLEAEKKITDSELKALKSQMNPHFIFNALNSIQSQFMYGDKITANEQLSNFTYLTRQILEVSGKKQIDISDEVEILTKYLELEKLRFDKDFEYSVSVSDAIDPDYHKIPPMLLQPLVENSVKHGLLHKKGDKRVVVRFDISTDESYLICTVTDNGIGREKAAHIRSSNKSNHNSFSIESIQQRLELLNRESKLKNLIVYRSLTDKNGIETGTEVTVKISFPAV